MKVQALIHTGIPGRQIEPGDILTLENDTAEEWIRAGWARVPRKGPKRGTAKLLPKTPDKPAEENDDGAGGGN